MFMAIFRRINGAWWSFLSFLGDTLGFEIKNPIVFYYGCPNSKKAQKLQLGKTVYR